MSSKIFFRRMTAVWTVNTQRKRISSHLHVENGSPTVGRYGTNSSASKRGFVTAMFAQMFIRLIIQNCFHLLLKDFSIWNSLSDVLCSAVCCCRLHPSLLLAPLNFKSAFFAPEDFSVSNLPLRGLTIRRSCVCCSVCMRNAWDSPIVNIVLQTMKRQLFMSALVIDGNSKSFSVECCLETKMRCDVNYCMTSWRTPSDIYRA